MCQMLVAATVHACVRAFEGTLSYNTILAALPNLQRQHGAIDAAGQVNTEAAKRLRVRECCNRLVPRCKTNP